MHTHVYPEKIAKRAVEKLSKAADIPAQSNGMKSGLQESMKRAGVDYSLLLPVATSVKQVDKMNENQLTALRKGNLGFIFQSFNLIDELTVCENVELPLIYIGVKANERKERVKKELEKVNLLHRANHYPQQLSGGQQQRVAIARAVVTDCKLLLADEPTGNLDSVNGIEVMELLSELNAQGTTIIIVTHSQRDAMYAHRVIQLLDGQIVAENVNRPLGKNVSAKNETV